jgi:hypothetical protein
MVPLQSFACHTLLLFVVNSLSNTYTQALAKTNLYEKQAAGFYFDEKLHMQ